MRLKRKDNQVVKILFLLLIFAVGIGYAYLTSNLSITGATSVAGNTWDIHFENLIVKEGSVTATTPATINPSDNTKINYAVLLNKPGDYYEFTVDMVNSGTLPGKVTLVELNGITSSVEDVIDYSIVYTNNNNPVAVDDILNAESSKNIKVRVYYKEDINEEDLLTSNVDLAITLNIVFNQSEEDEPTINTIIQQLKNENSSCFTKYTGEVTDRVGETVTASNVYYDKCENKRNIIFNNMCWQIVRTTETGGLKVIYNGEPVGGKCEGDRANHKGIVGYNGSSQSLNSEYLYGDSFTYDITNNTFTLTDTTTATWSDATYENLLGKFTCKNTTGTCTTLYNVNGFKDNTKAYVANYSIAATGYPQIGITPFNANDKSPAMVGYMFNKVYNINSKNVGTTEYKYGSSFNYDTSTNTYTLSGTTQNISNINSYNTINNTHYTCWNTSGICNEISFIYYKYSSYLYYINLVDGHDANTAILEMLSSNNVNRYNSSIKGIIDAWYRQNLIEKTNMLEDIVYCNARNMINQSTNGWNNEGDIEVEMKFKNYDITTNLTCLNETDQFSVSNNKAKLTYPVGLISAEEWFNIENDSTGLSYFNISPSVFYIGNARMRYVNSEGTSAFVNVSDSPATRPVISLSSNIAIFGGDGSTTNPWVVE